ncbi:hypothetical protein BJ170DRAFT_436284 [Xylariales sp. AK1849]|nr:hypothetical protein BJ170DRAFT_436284 [Xylariales sp. AK1849]
MVARTPPLGSLKKGFKKGILPQIHHPLPLNPRESQQLLNSITTSFRKNLDKEHPWQSPDATEPTTRTALGRPFTLAKDTTHKHRPTDRHLESILSNPLFVQPKNVSQPSPTTLQLHKRHEVFDSAVSKGMMTTRRAAGYLAAVRQDIQLSTLDPQTGVAASGAGLRVLQWLRASGAESSLEFISDRSLMQNLMPFVFVEGLDEVAWTWLSRLGSQLSTLPKDAQAQHSLVCLLQSILQAQAFMSESTGSLDSGYATFLRANRTLPSEDPAALGGLKRYWATLSWASTVNAFLHPKPSAPLYEMFVDVGRPWKKDLDIAHLELHHPTNPNHSPAVKYLHDDRTLASASAIPQQRRGLSDKYSQRMVSFGADTVDRLKEIGEDKEASWVSEFMSRTFFAWNLRNMRGDTVDASTVPR